MVHRRARKRDLSSGRGSVDCAWPCQIFQNLSGPRPTSVYSLFFISKFVTIGRIWPKIATEEALPGTVSVIALLISFQLSDL